MPGTHGRGAPKRAYPLRSYSASRLLRRAGVHSVRIFTLDVIGPRTKRDCNIDERAYVADLVALEGPAGDDVRVEIRVRCGLEYFMGKRICRVLEKRDPRTLAAGHLLERFYAVDYMMTATIKRAVVTAEGESAQLVRRIAHAET